jgi:hypothetical protein
MAAIHNSVHGVGPRDLPPRRRRRATRPSKMVTTSHPDDTAASQLERKWKDVDGILTELYARENLQLRVVADIMWCIYHFRATCVSDFLSLKFLGF